MYRIAISSGIITTLLIFLYFIVMFFMGNNIPKIFGIEYLFLALGIYSSHYFYRSENENLNFNEGLKLGIITTITFSLFLSLFMAIMVNKNNPEVFNTILKEVASKLKSNKDISNDEVDKIISKIKSNLTSGKIFFSINLFILFIGTIFSMLISFFTRNKKNKD